MKNRKFQVPILLLSALISVAGAFFILFYPGYLQDRTLLNCILTMGFKALKCGRALYFSAVAVGTVLLFISFKRWKSGRSTVLHVAAGSLLFCIIFFCNNYTSYHTADCIQLALLSFLSGIYCGLITPTLLFLLENLRITASRVLSIDYADIFRKIWKKYRVPFFSAVISGFLAYTWFLTNKILNHDEITCLFSKGASMSSGRWGLKLISIIFPNYSMPWLWGVITIFILAVSCCIIVDIFQIRNIFMRMIIPAVIITFPSQTWTMLYMFTTTSYACAFLLSVTVVRLLYAAGKRNKKALAVAVLLEIFALSIYQAYITVVSSLLVSLCIIDLVKNNKPVREILTDSLGYISFLAVSLGLYYVVNLIILRTANVTYNAYASMAMESSGNVLKRILDAFEYFYRVFSEYQYGIVTSGTSKFAHLALLLFIIVHGMKKFHEKKECWIFVGYTAVLLPLSMNGLFFLVGKESVHSMTVYSYIALYVVTAVLAEETICKKQKNFLCNTAALIIAVIVSSNILFANELGLEQYIEYENTYSIYQSVITQIMSLPEYTDESKIAFLGTVPEGTYKKYFEKTDQFPTSFSFRNTYSINRFISYYLGFDLQYANSEEVNQIYNSEEYEKMASYPYNGCIRVFNDIIAVKFS